MLISRQQYLVDKDNSSENIKALLFMKQSLEAINSRKENKKILKDDYKRNGTPKRKSMLGELFDF